MKVIFMGTPDFAVPALRALHARHQIVAVYCQPPRPAGRGKGLRKSPVQVAAEALGLPVAHPATLRDSAAQVDFAAHGADVAVVVAYGLILPPALLRAPGLGCLNIHASLLPRWRGAAPIHRAIMSGDGETGISIMQMDEGLDTGPVLMRQALAISSEETTAELQGRLSALGAEMITRAVESLPLPATPQPAEGVSYAAKIDKAEARVDFGQSAEVVDRLIRGLSPFPGAWVLVGGERIKLLRSRVVAGSGAPGQVLGGFVIACAGGAIEVLEAQREGKRRAPATEVLKGLRLPPQL